MQIDQRNEMLIEICQRDLADYAADRKKEVERGREAPELAALLVQKYGYGMWAVLDALTKIEDIPGISGRLDVDAAVASILPDWRNTDRQRWAAKNVSLNFSSDRKDDTLLKQ